MPRVTQQGSRQLDLTPGSGGLRSPRGSGCSTMAEAAGEDTWQRDGAAGLPASRAVGGRPLLSQ